MSSTPCSVPLTLRDSKQTKKIAKMFPECRQRVHFNQFIRRFPQQNRIDE
ncbi:hypothetical protein X948_5432 [Burkholderia pseudomallei MSHR5608]|nr:hypothetical protein X948_5432 [Burkholderia pseudomallei MSHR5608]